MRQTILVTGYGFISKHLLSSLLQVSSYNIIIVSRSDNKDFIVSPNVTYVVCDILELNKLRGELGDTNIDFIFHLASQSVVDQGMLNPIASFKINVEGTWNILEIAKERKVSGVVLASSMNVYKGNVTYPLQENDDISLESPYGYSKFSAETVAKHYSLAYKIPIIAIRLGMVFGGGDGNVSRLVPSIVEGIIKKRQVNLKSPKSTIVDLIYVKDVVRIFLKLIGEFESKKINFEVFNCSSNSPQTIEEVLNLLLKIASCNRCEINYGDRTQVVRILDNERINKFIQSNSRIPLEQALRETYYWYEHNGFS